MTAVAAGTARERTWSKSFYVRMAAALVLTAFLGFVPTYWQPLAAGKFAANPIVHIHGLLFFSWTLFVLLQTSLVATGQTQRHRDVGIVGVSLATAMVIVGTLVALNAVRNAVSMGAAAQGESFAILPLFDIVPFGVLVALAVYNTRQPEIHKRLMLLATIGIMGAPVARPFLAYVFTNLPPGPPPVWIVYPASAVVDLFLVAALAYDWRTRGRPHPVYVWGGAALVLLQVVRLPISETAAWHGLMRGFVSLGGAFPTHPA